MRREESFMPILQKNWGKIAAKLGEFNAGINFKTWGYRLKIMGFFEVFYLLEFKNYRG